MLDFVINFNDDHYQFDRVVLHQAELIDAEVAVYEGLQKAKAYKKREYWAECFHNGASLFRMKTEGKDVFWANTRDKDRVEWNPLPLDVVELYQKHSKYGKKVN